MSKRTTNPDSNQTAVSIVSEVTARHEKPLPAGVEVARAAWSASIQKMDARALA